MNEILKRLEDWRNENKVRAVFITGDDGFGANCWCVELIHENGKTFSYELSFFAEDKEKAKKNGIVFPEMKNEDEWPGLVETIKVALDAFYNGIWR